REIGYTKRSPRPGFCPPAATARQRGESDGEREQKRSGRVGGAGKTRPPKSARPTGSRFGAWGLGFSWDLGFGAWSFPGVWSVVFGAFTSSVSTPCRRGSSSAVGDSPRQNENRRLLTLFRWLSAPWPLLP